MPNEFSSSMECCGECVYNKKDHDSRDFLCSCEQSDCYGLPVMYQDVCEEFSQE